MLGGCAVATEGLIPSQSRATKRALAGAGHTGWSLPAARGSTRPVRSGRERSRARVTKPTMPAAVTARDRRIFEARSLCVLDASVVHSPAPARESARHQDQPPERPQRFNHRVRCPLLSRPHRRSASVVPTAKGASGALLDVDAPARRPSCALLGCSVCAGTPCPPRNPAPHHGAHPRVSAITSAVRDNSRSA